MVLIYAHTASPRLQYITHFLFRELMGVDSLVVVDSEYFKNYEGAKINYSDIEIDHCLFKIKNQPLLFESDIKTQNIECFEINNNKAFFKTGNSDFPFDIFAAAFYLLSRYEEYLPHDKDIYGRYDHTNSLAFKENFLQLPLINTWTKELAAAIQKAYPQFEPSYPAFKFLPTYDIDIAYSYKYKGLIRNVGGFIKHPSAKRLQVLFGGKDPFDVYDWLNELNQKYNLKPYYFFLVPEKNSRYDKNILPHKDAMWRLVKQHAKKYIVGLHPSWQSVDNYQLLLREKEYLTSMSDTNIIHSRQHYIRFNLPDGYLSLISAGIKADHSMGYGSINGFRASTASSFYWYDLEKDEQTLLRINPFCFMDANSFYEQKFTAMQAGEELQSYADICRSVHAPLCIIWHNNFLADDKKMKGWKEMYANFIARLQQ